MIEEILKEFKEKFANSKYFQDRYCLDWLKEKLTSFEKKVNEEAQEVIGVIKWREIGKKYKYWDYFEKEVKGEERNRIDREISKLLQEDANTKLNEPNITPKNTIPIHTQPMIKMALNKFRKWQKYIEKKRSSAFDVSFEDIEKILKRLK